MSFLSALTSLMTNAGRGAEDLFTLGGTELARKFGGQGAANVLNLMGTALGANFAAGGTGGLGIMGAGGGGGGAASMGPVGPMSQAGSTLGGGMGSPMNLGPSAMGSPGAAAGTSPTMQALQMMRMMPMGGGQGQAPQQQNSLAMIYKMFPGLQPGGQFGNLQMGGM